MGEKHGRAEEEGCGEQTGSVMEPGDKEKERVWWRDKWKGQCHRYTFSKSSQLSQRAICCLTTVCASLKVDQRVCSLGCRDPIKRRTKIAPGLKTSPGRRPQWASKRWT